MQDWKKETSVTEPQPLEIVAPDTYIQRKDIVKVERKQEGKESYTEYECMSREISVRDYNMLKSIEEISTDKAVEAYTLQLMEEGVI